MKIIFFGSDDFALVNLEALHHSEHEVIACVTQPDRAKGRGLKVISSPIKEFAQTHNIPVYQPVKINDNNFIDQLKGCEADLFVVIAYGKILPQKVLDIPQFLSMNVHGSLLPKYRGAAPINWAILNGDEQTGVSVIQMNTKMDAGDILAKEKIGIEAKDTSVSLRVKMAKLSAKTLLKVIKDIEAGKVSSEKQNEKDVTLAPKLSKDMGLIDWNSSAMKIHNQVRGLQPWPGAYTTIKNKRVKVIETEIGSSDVNGQSGQVLDIDEQGILVAAVSGSVLIKKVHPDSSKEMKAADFSKGCQLARGDKVG